MNIQGKVIAITGGAQGLGLCMATELAKRGVHLALVDVSRDKLDDAIALLAKCDCTIRGYQTNVAEEQQVEQLFHDIGNDFGALHGVINNAGILRDGLLLKVQDGHVIDKMSLDAWQKVVDVNLTGVFLCAREAAAKMIELDCEGVIINISSVSRAGNIGQTNYSAAKAGVAAMTVTWSKELSWHGIRAVAIAPGFIGTEMVTSMKSEVLDKIATQIPLGRVGVPEEVASTAIFIFENDYINGRVIEIDGGIRL